MKSDMFIDPKSDYAFKRFFGTVSNKELTIGFLNSLLNKDIKDIIFHNVEMQGNNTDSRKAVIRLSIVDLPAPFPPMTVTKSPSFSVKLRF